MGLQKPFPAFYPALTTGKLNTDRIERRDSKHIERIYLELSRKSTFFSCIKISFVCSGEHKSDKNDVNGRRADKIRLTEYVEVKRGITR